MPASSLRELFDAMKTWSRVRVSSEMKAFTARQPAVVVFVTAYLEEEGHNAAGLALQLVLALDAHHAAHLGRAPTRIGQRAMERALDEAEESFAELARMEPTLALRRMLGRHEVIGGEVLAALIELVLTEAEDEPALRPSIVAVFVAAKAVAIAYARANELPTSAASLGQAIAARRGAPLPRIGRNDPCPCGSGRKFKRCCIKEEPPPVGTELREVGTEPMQGLLFAAPPEGAPAREEDPSEGSRRWLDMRLPALRGKTPRAAVRTEAGRRRVRALVQDIERTGADRAPGVERVDVGWIRRELGLEGPRH
jgi:hypothetical protein